MFPSIFLIYIVLISFLIPKYRSFVCYSFSSKLFPVQEMCFTEKHDKLTALTILLYIKNFHGIITPGWLITPSTNIVNYEGIGRWTYGFCAEGQ